MPSRKPLRRSFHRLALEQLEDRRVLAIASNLVADINTSASFNQGASDPAGFVPLGNQVLFAASTLGEGRELWRSNGTASGTHLVKNINPFASSSNPEQLIKVGSNVFFLGDDGTTGVELFKSNGTIGGTVLVKDFPDTSPATPFRQLTAVGNKLFFFRGAPFATPTRELWVSDGTEQGTVKLKDFDTSSAPDPDRSVAAFNGEFYFAASFGTPGSELWKSDGTVQGTELVADIVPNTGFQFSSFPSHLTVIADTLFFSADTASGRELWRTNGTEEGTEIVADIAPDAEDSNPINLVDVAGTLFFTTNIGGFNHQLYKSNGSAAGTVQLKDFGRPNFGGAGPSELTAIGLTLFFSGYDADAGPAELWKSDGTPGGTVLVKDILTGSGGSQPQYLTNVNGKAFFRTRDDALWSSDGSEVGTRLVRASTANAFESPQRDMVAIGKTLFFATTDDVHARELWRAVSNEQPVLTVPGPATYTENTPAIALSPQGTVTDVDSPNFAGGRLTVTITTNATNADILFIRNQGTAAGRIGVVGSNVTFGGTLIGTVAGGRTGSPLVVSLNVNATPAATQALLRNILFRVAGENPSPRPRTLQFVLTDGDGGRSVPRNLRVNVVAVNDSPTLLGGGAVNYAHNTPAAVRLAANAVVQDPDSLNFAGGILRVQIGTGSDASNRLLIGGPFVLVGNQVRLNNIQIGLRTSSGVGTTELAITLNANASRASVQQLMRAIRFRTEGSESTTPREATFLLSDGDGGSSNAINSTVTVQ